MIIIRLHTALLLLASTVAAHLNDGVRRLRDDEEGLTTTEIAVAALASAAIEAARAARAAAERTAASACDARPA
jgi:hypothetical protein